MQNNKFLKATKKLAKSAARKSRIGDFRNLVFAAQNANSKRSINGSEADTCMFTKF